MFGIAVQCLAVQQQESNVWSQSSVTTYNFVQRENDIGCKRRMTLSLHCTCKRVQPQAENVWRACILKVGYAGDKA